MKKILLPFIFIYAFSVNAQIPQKQTIFGDTLVTSIGWKLIKKSDIKLGTGSLPSGDYKFVTTSSRSWLASSTIPIDRRANGMYLRIKDFRVVGNSKRGYVNYLVLGGGNIVNYECDIESAIKAGEIEVPEKYRSLLNKTDSHQPFSVADELTNIRKLLQENGITAEEYDQMKKKLLEKN